MDVDGGIRSARNAQVGHNLALSFGEIPEHWLFMEHSTFSILSQDIAEIEALNQSVDASYGVAAALLPPDPSLLPAWAHPKCSWSPRRDLFCANLCRSVASRRSLNLAGGHPMQDTSLRVLGLCIMMRQLGMVLVPIIASEGYGSVRTRLLHELAMIDLFRVGRSRL